MHLDIKARHDRRAAQLEGEFLEIELDRLTQLGDRVLDRLALRRRPRFRIESDISTLLGGGQDRSNMHHILPRDHAISLTLRAASKRLEKAVNDNDETITRGTTNVFADLGYANADERQTKLRLAHAINGVIARRRLTQVAAGEKLGVNQPKVSALANYKLDGFSVERLMTFLTALDQDVEIVVRAKPRSREHARISVVAA